MAGLARVIADELDAISSFVALLRQEQEALQLGQADSLTAIANQKNPLFEKLNALAERRNAMLAEAGHPADRAGMADWVARHPKERDTRAAWEKLLALALQARELHQQNGALIQMRLQATSEALSVLQQEAQRTALYGPNGQAAGFSGYRIIDSA